MSDFIPSLFGNEQPKHPLHELAELDNICDVLSEEELTSISMKVILGYDSDKQSQAEWLQKVEDSEKLVMLKKEPKNTPFPNSANIKYPLITNACLQFAARTYPEIIQDGKLVKPELVGTPDAQLELDAEGICTHLNYQLLGPDNQWEASTDKLLIVYPNVGFVCKKTYYDPTTKTNVSDLCHYKDLVLRNGKEISKLDDLQRITHVLYLQPNDLVENARAGLYSEDAVKAILTFVSERNVDRTLTFLEQHRFLDLDQDGYEEPYIVTQHVETHKIVRIKARYDKEDITLDPTDDTKVLKIIPIQYFTDYHFIRSPDGSFMSIGFGTLLLHMNETANTILNQLIDAGTLDNLQTGFIDSRIKLMGGQTQVEPGTLMRAKGVIGLTLKDGIFPMKFSPPSDTLLKLFGMLVEAAKEVTSSTDAMAGTQNAQNVPATSMLAMIEQGMKMHSAIQRRLYSSLKMEFRKMLRLNSKYVTSDEFMDIVGHKSGINPDAYKNPSIRIIPVADPNISSDAQRLTQAQVIMSLQDQPDADNHEIHVRLLQAAKVPNIEKILPPAKANPQPQPDPKMAQVQLNAHTKAADLQIKSRHQDLKEKQFAGQLAKIEAEITQMQANAVNLSAKAAKTTHDVASTDFQNKLSVIKTKLDATAQAHQQMVDGNIQSKQMALDAQKQDNQHTQAMTGLGLQQQQQAQEAQDNAADREQAGNDQDSSGNGVDSSSYNSGSDQ